MKHLRDIFLGLVGFCTILFAILFMDGGMHDYRIEKLYDSLNSKRTVQISHIKNELEKYRGMYGNYPKTDDFKILSKNLNSIEDDIRYHYSYESNGLAYAVFYPEDSKSGVQCRVLESSPEFLTPEIITKHCIIVRNQKGPNVSHGIDDK